MSTTREKIPQGIADRLLADNRHTCCICKNRKDVIIHHIDEDRSNNSPENLCIVCTSCHSDVHSNQGLGRQFTIGELEIYKKEWEDRCKVEEAKVNIVKKIFIFTEGHPDLDKNSDFLKNAISTASSGTTKEEVFQSVNASANLVADISGDQIADEYKLFVLPSGAQFARNAIDTEHGTWEPRVRYKTSDSIIDYAQIISVDLAEYIFNQQNVKISFDFSVDLKQESSGSILAIDWIPFTVADGNVAEFNVHQTGLNCIGELTVSTTPGATCFYLVTMKIRGIREAYVTDGSEGSVRLWGYIVYKTDDIVM